MPGMPGMGGGDFLGDEDGYGFEDRFGRPERAELAKSLGDFDGNEVDDLMSIRLGEGAYRNGGDDGLDEINGRDLSMEFGIHTGMGFSPRGSNVRYDIDGTHLLGGTEELRAMVMPLPEAPLAARHCRAERRSHAVTFKPCR